MVRPRNIRLGSTPINAPRPPFSLSTKAITFCNCSAHPRLTPWNLHW